MKRLTWVILFMLTWRQVGTRLNKNFDPSKPVEEQQGISEAYSFDQGLAIKDIDEAKEKINKLLQSGNVIEIKLYEMKEISLKEVMENKKGVRK